MIPWNPHPHHPGRLDLPMSATVPDVFLLDGRPAWFHWDEPDLFLGDVFATIWLCERHSFIVRIGNRPPDVSMLKALCAYCLGHRFAALLARGEQERAWAQLDDVNRRRLDTWPLPNVSFRQGDDAGLREHVAGVSLARNSTARGDSPS